MNTRWPAQIRELFETLTPAELDAAHRGESLSVEQVSARVDSALAEGSLTPLQRQVIKAQLLLWHDHLDPAHDIVQSIETGDGSLLHAIMHRREGDFGNAKYWLRRVGDHPAYGLLSQELAEWLPRDHPQVARQVLPDGRWDPSAFVDACDAALRSGSVAQREALKVVQQSEFAAILTAVIG